MNSCPCCYGKPCSPRCTCRNPGSSHGCRRCCRYGSEEQKQLKAKLIADRDALLVDMACFIRLTLTYQSDPTAKASADYLLQRMRDVDPTIYTSGIVEAKMEGATDG